MTTEITVEFENTHCPLMANQYFRMSGEVVNSIYKKTKLACLFFFCITFFDKGTPHLP